MGRERGLSAEIMALLARGRGYGTQSVVDITLSDGTELHFATAELMINGVQYLAKLHNTETLKLATETDEIESISLDIDNVDQELGTYLAAEVNLLNGATAVLGIVFIDYEIEGFIEEDIPLAYYDEKLSGDVYNAAVNDQANPPVVTFVLDSDLDSVIIQGKTVFEIFPSVTSPSTAERPPFHNDLPLRRGGGFPDIDDPIDGGGGRRRLPFFID